MIRKLKEKAHQLQIEAYALFIAMRDPRVPWYARVFTGLVIAHTFSPIDLIPDFIPVVGYLDDLVITPVGIAIALKMIPEEVMVDARSKASEMMEQGKPVSKAGVMLVIAIWIILIIAILAAIIRAVRT